jgi:uncharacterized protein YjbJ (UPF0337 family)
MRNASLRSAVLARVFTQKERKPEKTHPVKFRNCALSGESIYRRPTMNKDQVSGKVDELKGRAKEKVGEMTDNPDTQTEGLVDQGKVKVEQAYGDAKEAVKKESEREP